MVGQIALRGLGVENEIFSDRVRDGGYHTWRLLREGFRRHGLELVTFDLAKRADLVCEIHINVNNGDLKPAYLITVEPPQITRKNYHRENLKRYKRIFTWHDLLVQNEGFVKIHYPNVLVVPPVDGWIRRDRFCCLIAGNKAVMQADENELYRERVKAIRWFEKNASGEFDLYGSDWDLPPTRQGLSGILIRRFWRCFSQVGAKPFRPFPSYRGKLQQKRDALQRTRFSICYENVRDLPGYITEKIFDCFFSGCIPVYWGASNIGDYVPADCFIDRRQFRDTGEVYHYLKAIAEDEFRGYQQRIRQFLASDAAYQFGSEWFAETVVKTIVNDLAGQS